MQAQKVTSPKGMEKTLEQYDAVVNECLDLFARKTHDYGTSWRVLRGPSLTDQIMIKAQRIRTIQQVGESKVDEGVRPELVGILNYAAMALIQLERGFADSPDMAEQEALDAMRFWIGQARDLMEKKNHDYGEAWREMRVGSLVDLIYVKLLRIKQIENNSGNTLASEGIDANYLDIVNYAAFGLIQLSEK
jgi:hypothetical protein